MISIASDSAEISTKVMPSSQTSALTPGVKTFELSGVYMNHPPLGATPSDQRYRHDRAAEQVAPVAVGREPRKGEVARAEDLRRQVDREALHHRNGEQEQHHRAVHREDLVVGLRIEEARVRRGQLHARQHAEHAGDREEDERRDHHAHADDRMVDRGEALPARPGGPDLGSVRRCSRDARARCLGPADRRRIHSLLRLRCWSACVSAAEKSSGRWTMTAKRMPAWPMPQNSSQVPS